MLFSGGIVGTLAVRCDLYSPAKSTTAPVQEWRREGYQNRVLPWVCDQAMFDEVVGAWLLYYMGIILMRDGHGLGAGNPHLAGLFANYKR